MSRRHITIVPAALVPVLSLSLKLLLVSALEGHLNMVALKPRAPESSQRMLLNSNS